MFNTSSTKCIPSINVSFPDHLQFLRSRNLEDFFGAQDIERTTRNEFLKIFKKKAWGIISLYRPQNSDIYSAISEKFCRQKEGKY